MALGLLSTTVFSQKLVVGIIDRQNGNERAHIGYNVSTGGGRDSELRKTMENTLAGNPKFNWKSDFKVVYIGYEGQTYLVIISSKQKELRYNQGFVRALGVGFGNNEAEALNNAKKMLMGNFSINEWDLQYEVVLSEDYSSRMSKPLEKPVILSPKNYERISATYVTLKWSCESPNRDALTYTVLFGENDNSLKTIARDISATSYKVYELVGGKRYYWRVIVSEGKSEKKFVNSEFITTEVLTTEETGQFKPRWQEKLKKYNQNINYGNGMEVVREQLRSVGKYTEAVGKRDVYKNNGSFVVMRQDGSEVSGTYSYRWVLERQGGFKDNLIHIYIDCGVGQYHESFEFHERKGIRRPDISTGKCGPVRFALNVKYGDKDYNTFTITQTEWFK